MLYSLATESVIKGPQRNYKLGMKNILKYSFNSITNKLVTTTSVISPEMFISLTENAGCL
jgi:hypothetical protein